MQTICIGGRQPELTAAELESLFGPDTITSLEGGIFALDVPATDIPFDRLGTVIKLGRVLTILKTTSWPEILDYLIKTTPEHAGYLPEGKLTIGVSLYGLAARPAKVREDLITVKKAIQTTGRSVRIVPNKTPELSSAQVLHNKLVSPNGWELLCIRHGHQTILAQTTSIQDIEAYAARDQARPLRDAKVGMLPPKLAQLLLNLATAGQPDLTILDPFCGTGVVLQEALLMGYDAVGTDIDARMIEYSRGNIDWLRSRSPEAAGLLRLEDGDARFHRWPASQTLRKPYAVAAETYLGPPLHSLPKPDKLAAIISDVDDLHRRVLVNLAKQLPSGSRLCLAVPAWQSPEGTLKHLPLLDEITDLGYNLVSFRRASSLDPAGELAYRRPGQTVAREILTLIRK
jgi:SAM-dependent methyltransferase